MRISLAILACMIAACASRPEPIAKEFPSTEPIAPDAYCEKIAHLVQNSKDGAAVKLPCAYFTPLYTAMRNDNPANYACSANCAQSSQTFDEFQNCEKHEHCDEATSPGKPRPPGNDEELERYCAQMVRIDDGAKPRMGMWSCAFIGGTMKQSNPAMFACSNDCAMNSKSLTNYHACLDAHGCTDKRE